MYIIPIFDLTTDLQISLQIHLYMAHFSPQNQIWKSRCPLSLGSENFQGLGSAGWSYFLVEIREIWTQTAVDIIIWIAKSYEKRKELVKK